MPPGRKRGPRGQVAGGFQEPEAAWRVAAQVTAERAPGERENECRALWGPPRGLSTSLVDSQSPSVPRFQVRDPEGRLQPPPRGPRHQPRPARAARPRALSQARGRRGGRDWARKAAGRDLEKPPRLHCSGRGRRRSRFRRAACPRDVLRARFPGARTCGARGLVRGPRAAAGNARGGGWCGENNQSSLSPPPHPQHTPGGRLLLKKCYNCSGSPAPPALSGLWCRDLRSAFWVNAELDYLRVRRGSAALGA